MATLVLIPIQIIHAIPPSSHFATPLINEYLALHPKEIAMFKAINKMIKTFIIAKIHGQNDRCCLIKSILVNNL